ncbi:MAG: hypothetical protein EBV58_06835 [Actinobacteria bacterium]|nr:hypothetical protein [Actinomycetota bacterium]
MILKNPLSRHALFISSAHFSISRELIFGSDEIGNAKLLITGDVPVALHGKARRAESNCPERAITITE